MKTELSVLLILLFCTSLTSLAQPVRATLNGEILTSTGYVDLAGRYHVVGEVRNTGNQDAQARMTALFYDSNDRLIANQSSSTLISAVLAARKAPFDIILRDTNLVAAVDHYNLSLAITSYLEDLPLGLEIVSYRNYTDIGWMHIVGTLRNKMSGASLSTKLVATFYDETGKVTAALSQASDPESIGPGQQAGFDIRLSSERSSLVKSYVLSAESLGYGLISRLAYATLLILQTPPATVGISAVLTATLRDENRNPMANSQVDFQIVKSGNWQQLGSSVTNETGQAGFSFVPTDTGEFLIRASYAGGPDHYQSSDMNTLLVSTSPSDEPRPQPPEPTSPSTPQMTPIWKEYWFLASAGLSGIVALAIMFKVARRRNRQSVSPGS